MAGQVAQVEGIAETIAELRKVAPALARQAATRIKAPAAPIASALRATAPSAPLSRMGGYGGTKVTLNYKGTLGNKGKSYYTKRGDVWPLVRVRLTAPGWTVASDMARNASPGESMVPNLTRKYGAASRWAWPTVERAMPGISAAIRAAIKDVEREANAALGKGGRR